MPVDAPRLVAVGPRDDDVFGVGLVQPVPFLVAEDIEVERVEQLEVALHFRRLLFVGRRRGRRILCRRLRERSGRKSRHGGGSKDMAIACFHGGVPFIEMTNPL